MHIAKKGNIFMWKEYYYYFDLPKFRIGRAHTIKK